MRTVPGLKQGGLRSSILEGLFHDFDSYLTIVGDKENLGGLGGEALFDLEMAVPTDNVAQIGNKRSATRLRRRDGRGG